MRTSPLTRGDVRAEHEQIMDRRGQYGGQQLKRTTSSKSQYADICDSVHMGHVGSLDLMHPAYF